MSRARTILGLGTAGIAGGLLVAELAARLAFAAPEGFAGHLPDAELGWRPYPDLALHCSDARGGFDYVLNADGFRGPALPAAGAPVEDGARRLLFLGDSFLAGWNVRDDALLPAATRALLAERGHACEAWNVSCNGYGTGQELLALRRHGPRVRPDLVVLALYPGNDLADNTLALAGRTRVSSGALLRPYFVPDAEGRLERTWVDPLAARLRRLSRLWALLEQRRWRQRWGARGQYEVATPDEPLEQNARLRLGLPPRASLELFQEPDPGSRWETAWRTTGALLAALRDEAEAQGAELLVVVVPHRLQVEVDAHFRQLDAAGLAFGRPSMLASLDWELPERRLAAGLAAAGIAHVPLLGALRVATAHEGATCYQDDGHLNERGHRVAARAVADRLAARWSGAAAGAAAAPAEAGGGPVDLLALVWGANDRQDLRADEHDELAGQGWIDWLADWPGAGAGWGLAGDAWLTLPGTGGRFALEGIVPPDVPLPARFELLLYGTTLVEPVEITAAGPLRLEFPLPVVPSGSAPWIPLLLRSSSTVDAPGGRYRFGLVLQALERLGD